MMKITGLSHLFKWENLHNWWLTKYFFAPLYACLSTRPGIWCEVAGIVYSPASGTFGIIPAHLETHDVRCFVSPSRAFCSSHLENLLTFDEFEHMMRTVKKCFGNTKKLGNNVLKLRTEMHLIDDPWR